MNPLRTALALLVLAAVANAGVYSNEEYGNSNRNGPVPQNGGNSVEALHPAVWLKKVVQNTPSLDDVSFKALKNMDVNPATTLLRTIFLNSYLTPYTGPLYTPNANQLKMHLITANGNISIPLNNPASLKNYPHLQNGDLTIFISGVPSNSEDPSDAVSELVEAYRRRYEISDNQFQNKQGDSYDGQMQGSLIVIELGNVLPNVKQWAALDIEETGRMIGQAICDITEFIPYHNIHLVGHSVGAHVAGVAARYFSQEKNVQLRRVTGLDPPKILGKDKLIQNELTRGVADFVDVIHSTSYGVGAHSNGDADFYPNGPGSVAAGANNIIDASLMSLRYYTETVRPGSDKNFMAVECSSLKDYENNRCHGVRIPMGYDVPSNAKGNFVLRVNSKAPYGRNARRVFGNINNRRSDGHVIAY